MKRSIIKRIKAWLFGRKVRKMMTSTNGEAVIRSYFKAHGSRAQRRQLWRQAWKHY